MKAHPFFKSIDWDKLYRKELPVPYLPEVKDKLDHVDVLGGVHQPADRESVVLQPALHGGDRVPGGRCGGA